jgi:hypothetical protein
VVPASIVPRKERVALPSGGPSAEHPKTSADASKAALPKPDIRLAKPLFSLVQSRELKFR